MKIVWLFKATCQNIGEKKLIIKQKVSLKKLKIVQITFATWGKTFFYNIFFYKVFASNFGIFPYFYNKMTVYLYTWRWPSSSGPGPGWPAPECPWTPAQGQLLAAGSGL